MGDIVSIPLARGSRTDSGTSSLIAAWLTVTAVTFNFALAYVNANIAPISSAHVIAVEGLIIGLASIVIIKNYTRSFAPWFAMIWFAFAIAMTRSLWLPSPDAKSLRDVLIIPTFVCLGMICGMVRLKTAFIVVHVIVCTVVVLEYVVPGIYADLLNIKSYYIATRGFSEDNFWNQDSNAFVSATRPGERNFLPSLNIGRLSSVFTEPVSLGNYAIIATIFACVMKDRISRRQLVMLGTSIIALIVACDGRLAAITSLAIVISSPFAKYVGRLPILFLPLGVVGAFVVQALTNDERGDDLVGRVNYTARVLSSFQISDIFGIPTGGKLFADSGIAYLVQSQSLIGIIFLWILLSASCSIRRPYQAQALFGTLLYLSLNMIVSNSFLTIKTASLLYALLGATQVDEKLRRKILS